MKLKLSTASLVGAILLGSCLVYSYHHSRLKGFTGRPLKICDTQNYPIRSTMSQVLLSPADAPSDEKNQESTPVFTLKETFLPNQFDRRFFAWMLAGELLIFDIALLLNMFLQTMPCIEFNSGSMALATLIGLALSGMVNSVDRIPLAATQQIAQERRFYTLRILGRETPVLQAALIAALLAATAGFAEEYLFRGVIFHSLEQHIGMMPALVYSSILFGIIHAPLFGADVFVETIIGSLLALSYAMSALNLAVPIAAHTIFDFVTILSTWYFASTDLRSRMQAAARDPSKIALRRLVDSAPDDIASVVSTVFDILDANDDGFIDLAELEIARKVLGLSNPIAFTPDRQSEQLLALIDSNADGKISREEFFVAMMKDIAIALPITY